MLSRFGRTVLAGTVCAMAPQFPIRAVRPTTPTLPELPRTFLVTSHVASTGRTIAVPAGGDFQAALHQAQPGDEIVLEAGASYMGHFVLPEKQGSGWIIVRSSQLSQLPAPGLRVQPSDSAHMPKLVSPGTAPALKAPERAHHYRFVGLEITSAAGVPLTYNLVYVGGDRETPADMPHDLIFDRVYVHGHATLDVRRCLAFNGGATAIVDSYVSECHSPGFDSQAIGGWRGTGPYKIVNNHLEGAGENVAFGGAGFSPTWDVAADLEIRGNYFSKPLSWNPKHPSYAGQKWLVKNLFEIKEGQRWLVEGNVFENNWVDGQNGFAILYQAVDGTNAKISDIMFRYNIVRYSPGGINCCARHDVGTRGLPRDPLERIAFEHNLFADIGVDGGVIGRNGRAVQLLGDYRDTVLRHNTFFGSSSAMVLDGIRLGAPQRVTVTDNIFQRGQYGVMGRGTGEGMVTLGRYHPGGQFVGNVIWGNASVAGRYPGGNYFPGRLRDLRFADDTTYGLGPGSPFRGVASDGSDPGPDSARLRSATARARTGR